MPPRQSTVEAGFEFCSPHLQILFRFKILLVLPFAPFSIASRTEFQPSQHGVHGCGDPATITSQLHHLPCPFIQNCFQLQYNSHPSVSLGFVNAVLYPQRSFAMGHTTLDLNIKFRYSVITSPSKPIWPSESIIFTIPWANHDRSPYYSNLSLSPLSF